MRHSHRSAIALVTSGLLAGGALGAAALARQHNGGESATQVAAVGTNSGSDLSAAIQDILAQSAAMHARMLATRTDLAEINRRLRERASLARAAAAASSSVIAQATLSPDSWSTAEDSSGATSPDPTGPGDDSSGSEPNDSDGPDSDDPTTLPPATTSNDDDSTGGSEQSPASADPTGGDDETDDDPGDNGGTGHDDD